MGKDLINLRRRLLKYIEKHWVMNNHSLKEISCVYVIAAYDFYRKHSDIVYVGSTTNIFLRYKSHKVPEKVQSLGFSNILFFLPMKKGFYDYEIKLINRLKPLFNRQHKNGS